MISYSTSVRPIVAAVSMVPVVGLVIVWPVVVETYIYIYIYIHIYIYIYVCMYISSRLRYPPEQRSCVGCRTQSI